LLTDDGKLILTYTNPDSWRYFLRKLKHWRNGPLKYNHIKLNELNHILQKYNLEINNMSGFNWLPLPLTSNSRLVLFFGLIEKVFRLDKWYSQSPWILMSIKKVASN